MKHGLRVLAWSFAFVAVVFTWIWFFTNAASAQVVALSFWALCLLCWVGVLVVTVWPLESGRGSEQAREADMKQPRKATEPKALSEMKVLWEYEGFRLLSPEPGIYYWQSGRYDDDFKLAGWGELLAVQIGALMEAFGESMEKK